MVRNTPKGAEKVRRENQGHGFIGETRPGGRGVEGKGKGKRWRLTELGFMGDQPTKNYRDWKPQKNKTPSYVGGQGVLLGGTVKGVKRPLTVLLGGTI